MQQILNNPIVIGSSDIVLEKELGGEIDKFDTIVRFNRAPTQGFEKYVGSRTDLRVVNPHVFENIPNDNEDLSFLPSITNEIIAHDPGVDTSNFHKVFDSSCNRVKINRHSHFKQVEYDIVNSLHLDIGPKGIEPSIGLGVICYYINNNVIPTIYGFHLHDDNRNVAPHYWNIKPKVGPYHNYSYERKLIKKLIELDYIKLLS